jgi:hypothetical protein
VTTVDVEDGGGTKQFQVVPATTLGKTLVKDTEGLFALDTRPNRCFEFGAEGKIER